MLFGHSSLHPCMFKIGRIHGPGRKVMRQFSFVFVVNLSVMAYYDFVVKPVGFFPIMSSFQINPGPSGGLCPASEQSRTSKMNMQTKVKCSTISYPPKVPGSVGVLVQPRQV